METSSLTRFAQACGAVRPLELCIDRPNGTVVSQASVLQPCAVIGHESYCDVVVPDTEIAARHVALQVIDGRVFAMDLSGRANGLTFNGVARRDGWIDEGETVGIGSLRLRLTAPVSAVSPDYPPAYHPLVPNPDVVGQYAKAAVEFRNGRTAQNRWEVNRILTFVGRAKMCKINLTSEDVSLYHCYFLLTADGLWVVDVFGRGGVTVDGIPVRFARLRSGDDVRIARFHLGCVYPNGNPGDPVIPLASAAPANTPPKWPDVRTGMPAAPVRQPSGSTPAPTRMPFPTRNEQDEEPPERVEMPKDLVLAGGGLQKPADANQARMFEQFQQSMLMMMKMFGQMQQQQMAGIQQEMARLATLTEELHKLQGQIVQAVGPAPVPIPHHNPLPDPETVPTISDESANQHQFVFERMAQMEAERQSIWQRLAGLVGPKPTSA